jgi:hypothetical protein
MLKLVVKEYFETSVSPVALKKEREGGASLEATTIGDSITRVRCGTHSRTIYVLPIGLVKSTTIGDTIA